ncbi:MAG: hypothetical protein U0414_14445 [Polyangiaceae bacterium]
MRVSFGPMRIQIALLLAVASAGCAGRLTTRDRPEEAMRLQCSARSNGKTIAVGAALTRADAEAPSLVADARGPERIYLDTFDHFVIKSGDHGAGLSLYTDLFDMRDGESWKTYAYEAAIPAGPMLQIALSRFELGSGTVWVDVPLPTAPELTLVGQQIAWTPSTVSGPSAESLEIHVACNDGELPKVETNTAGERVAAPMQKSAKYKPPKDEGGIAVETLLALAKVAPAYNTSTDWSGCAELGVVVSRSAQIELTKSTFAGASCFVESSRSIQIPRAASTAPRAAEEPAR